MPLPWKKTKPNRISRIVADLQPPKRGGSLVVETGFPTSVIDLFVKNRDRLKRQSSSSSSKKKFTHPLIDPYIYHSVAPPPTPLPSPDYSSFLAAAEAARRKDVNVNLLVEREEEGGEESAHVQENENENGNGNGVFLKVIKMVFLFLVVVVLAWSSKKLVVGIMLSVFLLWVVERFGKYGVGFVKDGQVFISDWIDKIHGWFFILLLEWKKSWEFKREKEDGDGDCDGIVCELMEGGEEQSSSCSIEEIQILESNYLITSTNSYGVENENMGQGQGQGQGQGFQHDFLSREKRWGCLEYDDDYEEEESKFPASKNRRSRSAKLKAKIIKKLIPKKLRSGKKLLKMNKVVVENNNNNKTEVVCSEMVGYEDDYMRLDDDQQNGSVSSCGEEEEDERNGMNESWNSSAETGIIIEKKKQERIDRHYYCMEKECVFVVVMILSGLLGGRFVALLFTISGCFIFKLIKILNHKLKFG